MSTAWRSCCGRSRSGLPIVVFLAALVSLLLSVVVSAEYHHHRDHSKYEYYTVRLKSENTADVKGALSRALEMEYVGRVGELNDYALYRRPLDSPLSAEELQQHISNNNNRDDHRSSEEQHHGEKVMHLIKRHQESMPLPMSNDWSHAVDHVADISRQTLRLRHGRAPPATVQQLFERDAPPSASKHISAPAIARQFNFKDPLFSAQWHLVNDEDYGHDLNVTGVWSMGVTGKNVTVAIIDDGVEYDSDDLRANFAPEASYDFNEHTNLPTPKLWDDYHGTRCAGQIAAVANDVCGVGVAYNARVGGLRILSGPITDVDEAAALNYAFQTTSVYSCSWGPADDGKAMEAPNEMIMRAMIKGIEEGRKGKGSVYVFATGNGGFWGDNCNFDGYTNSIYTISVGAIDHTDSHPFYSEACSAQLVVTYSNGGGKFITTTNKGKRECTDRHGGTSAAAPLAAGVMALVLSARPDLTWRDVQHLCVQTAIPVSLSDPDWTPVANGRIYNHKYGYGKLDAFRIVEAAKSFKLVRNQTWYEAPWVIVNSNIPQGSQTGLTSTVKIEQSNLDEAELGRLEHVTVTINLEHSYRGDVEVHLVSPHGYTSELAAVRPLDDNKNGYRMWTFMTVKHWDENPLGDWTLRVLDRQHPEYTGKLLNWTMTLWGEEIEGATGQQDTKANKPTISSPTGHRAHKVKPPHREKVSAHIEPPKQTNVPAHDSNQSKPSAPPPAKESEPKKQPLDEQTAAPPPPSGGQLIGSLLLTVILGVTAVASLVCCLWLIGRWRKRSAQSRDEYQFQAVPMGDIDSGEGSPDASYSIDVSREDIHRQASMTAMGGTTAQTRTVAGEANEPLLLSNSAATTSAGSALVRHNVPSPNSKPLKSAMKKSTQSQLQSQSQQQQQLQQLQQQDLIGSDPNAAVDTTPKKKSAHVLFDIGDLDEDDDDEDDDDDQEGSNFHGSAASHNTAPSSTSSISNTESRR